MFVSVPLPVLVSVSDACCDRRMVCHFLAKTKKPDWREILNPEVESSFFFLEEWLFCAWYT